MCYRGCGMKKMFFLPKNAVLFKIINSEKTMTHLLNGISEVFYNIFGVLKGISFGDVLDILILTFLIYKAIQLVRETHAGQLLKGIVFLVLIDLLVNLLDMTMMKVILQTVWSVGILALIVLFQPELRHVLEQLGRNKLSSLGRTLSDEEAQESIRRSIEEVCKACVSMSSAKVGALIVFENKTILNDVVESGSSVDAIVSREMLENIFYPKAPLHDGAVLIRDGRIHSAACILPLTKNTNISLALGTRHRAAIGMSENSDATVVVVSEETGTISVASKGNLKRDFDAITLKTELENSISGVESADAGKKSKNPFKRMGWFK